MFSAEGLCRIKLQLLQPSGGVAPRPLSEAAAGTAVAASDTAIAGVAINAASRPRSILFMLLSVRVGGYKLLRGGRHRQWTATTPTLFASLQPESAASRWRRLTSSACCGYGTRAPRRRSVRHARSGSGTVGI